MGRVSRLLRILTSLILLGGCFLVVSVHGYLDRDPFSFPIATPDFRSFTNAKDKKQAFLQYLLPAIRSANSQILLDRKRLKEITEQETRLTEKNQRFIDQLAEDYGMQTSRKASKQPQDELFTELLMRVDELPESLILAKAVKQSGWGTSSYAVKANNYFGQSCDTRGCGIALPDSDKDSAEEILMFNSVEDSVHNYLNHLNTDDAYSELRSARASLRQQESLPKATLTATLLDAIPEEEMYIREIVLIMRQINSQ